MAESDSEQALNERALPASVADAVGIRLSIVEQAFRQARYFVPLHWLTTLFVALLIDTPAQREAVLLWAITGLVLGAGLFALAVAFRHRTPSSGLANWRLAYLFLLLVLAAQWAFCIAQLLDLATPQNWTALAAIATLVLCATLVLAIDLPGFMVFFLPLLGATLFSVNTLPVGFPPIAVIAAVMTAGVMFNVWGLHRILLRLLTHRLQQDTQRQQLEQHTAHLDHQVESLNQQLQQQAREQRERDKHAVQLQHRLQENQEALSDAQQRLKQQISLRKTMSDALVKSQTRLSQAIEASQLGLWDWDVEQGRIYQSHFHPIYGARDIDQSALNQRFRRYMPKPDYAHYQQQLRQYLSGKIDSFSVQYRLRLADDRVMWVEDCGKAIQFSPEGRVLRMLGTRRDISAEKAREEQIRLAQTVVEHTSEGVFVLDATYHFMTVNPAFQTITGFSDEDISGLRLFDTSAALSSPELMAQVEQGLNREGRWQGELLERRHGGDYFPLWLQLNCVRDDDGQISHIIGLFADLTERKEADERMHYLLNYDELTGLTNRTLFQDRLHNALENARKQHQQVALLLLNLDRFKQINESLGHDSGDVVLKEIAHRLLQALPQADTIGRLGGDEFGLILPGLNKRELSAAANRLLDSFSLPFAVDGHDLMLSASIGISQFPQDGQELEALRRQAEAATQHAKYLGGSKYQFCLPHQHKGPRQRLHLESDLRRALARRELQVFYQPKLHLRSQCIESLEALVRWQHPERGLISPTEFINTAEESGLVAEMGDYVLQQAGQDLAQWRSQGFDEVRVSVNLSSHQLRQKGLLDTIKRCLQQNQWPADKLEMELTESALLDNMGETINTLAKLRALGVRISLDDFGTGYSSLSYLRKLPVDALKVDRMFIADAMGNEKDAAITRAIIVLGQSLKLEVIAEGIESGDQLEFLALQGCDVVQGFYISPPLDAAETLALLLRQRRDGGFFHPGIHVGGDSQPLRH